MMFHHLPVDLRRWILLSIFLVLVGVGVWAFQANRGTDSPDKHEDEIHYHAAFQVYDGEMLLDFSGLEFQHVESCTGEEHEDELTAEEAQIEKAHLHDGVGDIVHVHREGAIWGDLFINIDNLIGPPISGYINGESVESILATPIKADDRVLIILGEDPMHVEAKLDGAPSIDYIREQERLIENC